MPVNIYERDTVAGILPPSWSNWDRTPINMIKSLTSFFDHDYTALNLTRIIFVHHNLSYIRDRIAYERGRIAYNRDTYMLTSSNPLILMTSGGSNCDRIAATMAILSRLYPGPSLYAHTSTSMVGVSLSLPLPPFRLASNSQLLWIGLYFSSVHYSSVPVLPVRSAGSEGITVIKKASVQITRVTLHYLKYSLLPW